MEQKRKVTRRKESPLLLFLAVLLLIVTLVTPFVYLAPANRLSRAVEKTVAEAGDEEVLRFLGEVLWDGSFEAVAEGDSLSYTATLPKAAALAGQGNFGSYRVALQGDDLYLYSSGLGKEAFSAPRRDASLQLCNSAFSDAGMPAPQMRLLRSALSLSDDDFSHSLEVLKRTLSSCFTAGRPDFSSVGEELRLDGKQRRVTNFTYEMGEEGLKKALSALKRAGKEEGTAKAYGALRGFLSATLSRTETADAAQRFVSFLCGEGEEFAAFEKDLLSKNSRLCLSVTVYKERVVRAKLFLGGGDFVFEVNGSLSEKGKKGDSRSVELYAKDFDRELFSLSFRSETEEDSKSALIRTWSYSYTDAAGFVTPGEGQESGEIIFSWGKAKKDLGLRWVLGEDTVVFRGELAKYKKGRKLEFYVDRVEWNGRKISEGDRYTVTLSKKGETPAKREATKNLFPDGDERTALAEALLGRLDRFNA